MLIRRAIDRLKAWVLKRKHTSRGRHSPKWVETETLGKVRFKDEWLDYPIEPTEHEGHVRSTTMAEFGPWRVCYCRECGKHYRNLKKLVG